ncbi:hypothetical protein G6F31_010649 [Rhizopus arrhizus]|nr:hypothetical protein G6F31_010649 [Rhizopus arrhizus]
MSAACTLDFPTVPFPPRAGARGVAVAYAGGRGQAIAWIACWTQAPVRRYAVRFRAVPNWIAQLATPGAQAPAAIVAVPATAFGRGQEGNGPHAGPWPVATHCPAPHRCCLPATTMARVMTRRRLRVRTVRRWPPSSAGCTRCAAGHATT